LAYAESFRRRQVVAILGSATLWLVAVILPASAVSKNDVERAKARVEQLESEIAKASDRLEALEATSAQLADAIFQTESDLAETEAELASIEEQLADAEEEFGRLQRRLNEQAVNQYMYGAAGTLDMILGADSFGELSDRVVFASAVSQQTSDLSDEVERLRATLGWQRQRQRSTLERQRSILTELEDRQEELFSALAEQESLIEDIDAKKAEAEREARSLGRQYQQQLQAALDSHIHPAPSGGSVSGPNPLLVCPVGTPRGFSDGFGAPRYGGGYHPHGGVDIIAPQGTPIYATFPGVARDASNGLGGISVIVSGSQGWTYNAHMVSIAKLGPVNTGDVIGYVGATGDTSTPHNHFEWHPNVTPSDWPESAYGYSVIGTAVNPYPLLTQVC
jgi:murein DD-endopeptidase MepM/ murein hydrolase activator NlpD